MGEEVELLKHHADAAPDLAHRPLLMGCIQANTQHIQLTAVELFQTVERADQGAFPRSGRPHHHQHFPTGHLKADPIKSTRTRGVALHQIGGADSDGHRSDRRGSSRSSRWRASRAMAVHASQ